jgi:creatinine amidohydrolase
MVYVNAHGGNVEALREVGRRLHADGTAYAIEWMWNESIPELVAELFDDPGPHAGPNETAMVWHIADAVREAELAAARDGGLREIDEDATAGTAPGRSSTPSSTATTAPSVTRRRPLPRRAGGCSRRRPTDWWHCEWLAARPWVDLAPREHSDAD